MKSPDCSTAKKIDNFKIIFFVESVIDDLLIWMPSPEMEWHSFNQSINQSFFFAESNLNQFLHFFSYWLIFKNHWSKIILTMSTEGKNNIQFKESNIFTYHRNLFFAWKIFWSTFCRVGVCYLWVDRKKKFKNQWKHNTHTNN